MPKLFLKNLNSTETFEREFEKNETISDIKEYIYKINDNLLVSDSPYSISRNAEITNSLEKENREFFIDKNVNNKKVFYKDIKIIYNGKLVNDDISLSSLEKEGNVYLNFLVKNEVTCKKSDTFTETKITNVDINKIDDIQMESIVNTMKIKVNLNGKKIEVDPNSICTHNGKLILITKREKKKDHWNEIHSIFLNLNSEFIIKFSVIIALFITKNTEFAFILCFMLLLRFLSNLKFHIVMKYNNKITFTCKTLIAFLISMFMINSDAILKYEIEN